MHSCTPARVARRGCSVRIRATGRYGRAWAGVSSSYDLSRRESPPTSPVNSRSERTPNTEINAPNRRAHTAHAPRGGVARGYSGRGTGEAGTGGCIHLERRDGRANTAQRLPHTRAPAPSPPAPIAASAHASAAEKGSHPESSRIKVEQYFGGRFCGTTGRRRNAPSDSLERDAAHLGGARRA